MEPDGENIGNIKRKARRWAESTRGCCGNTVNRPSVSGRRLSALGLPKESFLILNSADMFSQWELRTFI